MRQSSEVEKELKEKKFNKIIPVGDWLEKQKFFKPIVLEETDYQMVVPFNHYESPYPDIVEIHKYEEQIFDDNKEVLGIDFNINVQLELLKHMESLDVPEWPEERKDNGFRYYYNNNWFGKGSANALYYMIRIIKPKNIIEIGSGFSTSVMLDTNENYFNNKINIISIEPRTDRLKALLKDTDNIKIHERELQEIPINYFETLEENDILFIDSSHVSKINSDVNYLFFEILPRLKKGVYIHFHDMFYPFIYPKKWIYEGRAYNEMYIMRAFLMNNKDFSIQLFGHMLQQKYKNKIAEKMQGCGSGSLWIKKER